MTVSQSTRQFVCERANYLCELCEYANFANTVIPLSGQVMELEFLEQRRSVGQPVSG
jgi:hypothetical protein